MFFEMFSFLKNFKTNFLINIKFNVTYFKNLIQWIAYMIKLLFGENIFLIWALTTPPGAKQEGLLFMSQGWIF